MSLYFQILSWLEQLMLPCLYKALFNFPCPGCGLQRSFFMLLRGDVSGSLQMYWATIPIIILFLYLFLYLVFRFRLRTRVVIFLYSINGILIICQYIYTITQHH